MASSNTKTKLIIPLLGLLLTLLPFGAFAAANYNHLLDDSDIFIRRLSQAKILALLQAKGALGNYTEDVDGVQTSAADIFFRAQEENGINAAYLIATAQKESSIITATTVQQWQLDWTMGFAVCDSCSTDDPQVAQYKGFHSQILNAAYANKVYPTRPERAIKVGVTTNIDGIDVTPDNQATVNMFIYTPHLHGNELVTNIYKSWFGVPTHPQGTVVSVRGETNSLYLVDANETLRPYTSQTAFYSNHKATDIISIDSSEKVLYTIGAPIRFADFTLIRIPGGRIYMIRDGKLANIQSPKVFRKLGFNPEEIQNVTLDDIVGYDMGPQVTLADNFPASALVRVKGVGGVWYVKDGMRYAIPDRAYLKQLPPMAVKTLKKAAFEALADAGKLKLKDGTLVTSPNAGAIYIISGGLKRAFDSKQTFDSLGYSFKNMITVPDRTLAEDIHPTGGMVTMDIPLLNDTQTIASTK